MGGSDDQNAGRRTRLLAVLVALVAVAVVIGILAGWVWALPVLAITAVVALVMVGRPGPKPRRVDPFGVGEPWRQFVQRAQRSERDLARIVASTPAGPLKDRLAAVAARLDRAVEETWQIAQRGDTIDGAVRDLDPVGLRARLGALRAADGPDGSPAVAAVARQLETVERMQAQSSSTAARLQLTQLRVEELVARAAEVSVGAADTAAYAHDVDDLLIELEALRQAIDETDSL